MALLFIQTTFTIDDMDVYVPVVPLLDRAIKEKAKTLGVSAGLTGLLVVGKDEMVTSEQGLALSMLIALLGLGIDYTIHILTTFIQEREEGKPVPEAVKKSIHKSGAGILIASLGAVVKKRPIFFSLFMRALGLLPATQAPKVRVEGNLMNMEARGLESVELQYRMVEEFGMAPDMMSVITPHISEMRRPVRRIKKLASVKAVESPGTYYPSSEEQSTRAEQAVCFAAGLNAIQPKIIKLCLYVSVYILILSAFYFQIMEEGISSAEHDALISSGTKTSLLSWRRALRRLRLFRLFRRQSLRVHKP